MRGRIAALAIVAMVLAALGAMTLVWVDLTYYFDRVRFGPPGARDPLAVVFNDPSGLWVDDLGRVYFSVRRQHTIWMIDGGKLSPLAGTGKKGYSGDGRPAVRARLNHPEGLTGDADGNLYVADSENHRVRRISPDGTIVTVAGTGIGGYSGDGEQATWARLFRPMDVTLHPDGTLAVADWGNHRIRVVGADGVISTVAGNGELGFSGDGGPATEARINEAYGIAYDGEGRLYIADSTNHRVRRVELDGTIHTVAGVGKPGYGGDGGPAIDAHFDSPQALALREDGVWIVNDEHNHRLRLLHANGTVTHFAGNGRREWCGDGGPAATACFDDPEGIAFAPDGALWVTDGDNHRVRRIDADGTIATIAGNGPVGKKE